MSSESSIFALQPTGYLSCLHDNAFVKACDPVGTKREITSFANMLLFHDSV